MKQLKARISALVAKLGPKPKVTYTWVTKRLPDDYDGPSYWIEIPDSCWPREIQQRAGNPPPGVVICEPPERRRRRES